MNAKDTKSKEPKEMKEKPDSNNKSNEDLIRTEDSFSSDANLSDSGAVKVDELDVPELKKRLKEAEDKYLRTVAEFDNYKKRSARQFDEIVHAAESRIFNDALEIVDNFKRALENKDNQKDFESFKKGMQLIFEQMKEFLNKHKVEPIESVGQRFDPELHEAIMQIETDEHPEGVIAQELSTGFKKGEKVIRYSKVGVSTGKAKEE